MSDAPIQEGRGSGHTLTRQQYGMLWQREMIQARRVRPVEDIVPG